VMWHPQRDSRVYSRHMSDCADCARVARYIVGTVSFCAPKCLRHRDRQASGLTRRADPAAARTRGDGHEAWMSNVLQRIATDLDRQAADAEPERRHELSFRAALLRSRID